MRTSQYLLATEKEIPNDAELISHQLMIRAGMIRKQAAGIYSWLPTGIRVLRKVEAIVREEMDRAGAIETLMPNSTPAELWQETGRWEKYGPELLRFKDRHQRDFCFGPTHEEAFTEIARKALRSYKQLPLNLYQIQTKFRDEIRPRFGVMRGREFLMKDAYSFHSDEACLQHTYQAMYDAYMRIFKRLGLNVRAVLADTGAIGGENSHEFQVLAQAGEDVVAYSDGNAYAANIEKATCLGPQQQKAAPKEALSSFATPNAKTIQDLADQFAISAKQSIKTLIGKNKKGQFFAFILRGDHELNDIKAAKLDCMQGTFEFATEAEIRALFQAGPGSLGPVGSPIAIIVDRDAAVLSDFVCGANEDDKHYRGVNWDRDIPTYTVADIRNVQAGDISPDGQGTLHLARGIEVGHIFQLGTVYSAAMKATVLNEAGKAIPMVMGCYGLGVSRVVAAAIEQHHDAQGIVWPQEMAPFHVAIIPIGYQKSAAVKAQADQLYEQLMQQGFEVILDDRNERPGVMFADMDLIGIPHRIVLSERLLEAGQLEYKARQAKAAITITASQLPDLLAPNCAGS